MNDITLMLGDCLERLKELPDNSVDSIVTDPPYGLSEEPDIIELMKAWANGEEYKHKSKGGFMGKEWDSFVPSPKIWKEAFRVLKPGGYLLSFFSTRTYDVGSLAIRTAGFEMRDTVMWVHSQGFPKSLNISKAIDKAAGAERKVISEVKTNSGGMAHISKTNAEHGFRPNAYTGNSEDKSAKNVIQVTEPATDAAKQWDGWGTALKPALEPITVARKPISEKTVAENVLKHGTGGINIDGSRVAASKEDVENQRKTSGVVGVHYTNNVYGNFNVKFPAGNDLGRFPANLIHDGSEEVVGLFPNSKSCNTPSNAKPEGTIFGGARSQGAIYPNEDGSAARFFYCAKTSKKDRNEGLENLPDKEWRHEGAAVPERNNRPFLPSKNNHPTVKPTELMRYLVKLVTPPNGVVLDPFMGSGSTGKAAKLEGFKFIGVELDPEYLEIAKARIEAVQVKKTLEGFFTDDDS
jgi:DNA modification methylase